MDLTREEYLGYKKRELGNQLEMQDLGIQPDDNGFNF